VISCQQLIDFCFDYIEGDLPDDEQLDFRRHLGHCPDCVTFFETYRRTPEVSREVMGTRIPATVKEAVRTYLRDRHKETSPPDVSVRDPEAT
jgi:anti-sigma factor RsiW